VNARQPDSAGNDPARYVLLRGADPGMAGSPCHSCGAAAFPGRVFVGVDLQAQGTAGFLCPACSRTGAPTLAAVAEALNLLHALTPDIDPSQRDALAGALAEIARIPVGRLGDPDERTAS
jgi:hypothetical protein